MNKFQNLSREELLKLVEKQDQELAAKKYGLVWDAEREPEQVVLDCENSLPVLKRVKEKEVRTTDEEDNILIEGDNYHALTVLSYTHKEKIDVIYIDPPYNTGNKSWKYNNRYVEKDDGYYHSKWLNMMEKRLNVARRLLKSDGCLICAVDENEQANLGLLLEKIFPGYKKICITIIHNPRGIQGKDFSYTNEFTYFVFPEKEKGYIERRSRSEDDQEYSNLRNWGGESERNYGKSLFYPIITKDNLVINVGEIPADDYHPSRAYERKKDSSVVFWPIDNNGVERKWRYSRESVLNIKHLLRVNDVGGKMQLQILKDNDRYKTVWTDKKFDSNKYGTQLVNEIVGTEFPFPKSLYNVKECLMTVLKNKKHGIVLDFFAGSGTTGHAILDMNIEDGGKRKFILCTNNESNICEEVTYPRIKNVINGYKFKGNVKKNIYEKHLSFSNLKNIDNILKEVNAVIDENKNKLDEIKKEFKNNTIVISGIKNIKDKKEGLGGNLQYFKTAMVKKTNNKDQVRINLTRECTEMLCVKENIFNLEKEAEDYKIFSSNKKDKFLCVYYNFLDESFDEFLKEIKKLKGQKIIYMFSADDTVDENLFKGIDNIIIEAIPQRILDIYKQLVKLNIPVKKELIFLEFNKAKMKIFDEGEKDEGARILRIVLEKVIQKISQSNGVNIYNPKGKEEKIALLNDVLKNKNVINKVEWQETQTCLAIGNHASHGDYGEYDLDQVKNFYKHIQNLLNKFNI